MLVLLHLSISPEQRPTTNHSRFQCVGFPIEDKILLLSLKIPQRTGTDVWRAEGDSFGNKVFLNVKRYYTKSCAFSFCPTHSAAPFCNCVGSCKLLDRKLYYKIMELLRLDNNTKIIKANHDPITTIPCPSSQMIKYLVPCFILKSVDFQSYYCLSIWCNHCQMQGRLKGNTRGLTPTLCWSVSSTMHGTPPHFWSVLTGCGGNYASNEMFVSSQVEGFVNRVLRQTPF